MYSSTCGLFFWQVFLLEQGPSFLAYGVARFLLSEDICSLFVAPYDRHPCGFPRWFLFEQRLLLAYSVASCLSGGFSSHHLPLVPWPSSSSFRWWFPLSSKGLSWPIVLLSVWARAYLGPQCCSFPSGGFFRPFNHSFLFCSRLCPLRPVLVDVWTGRWVGYLVPPRWTFWISADLLRTLESLSLCMLSSARASRISGSLISPLLEYWVHEYFLRLVHRSPVCRSSDRNLSFVEEFPFFLS